MAARHALRTRFRALRGQVLLHHPVLWWAAVRGLAPLHVSVLEIDGTAVLLAGPGGVGKSSLVARELAAGGRAVCDNLAVSDGTTILGVAEPLKVPPEAGSPGDGPVAPHGRRERPWPERLPALRPQLVVVLRRGDAAFATVRPTTAAAACRELVAGTFTAGELRRFWPLAASLALATDRGPAVPPVETVAARLVQDLPCVEVRLGRVPGEPLRALLHDRLGRDARREVRVMSDVTRIEVAQVVTRFIAGAGGVALRGALELDPEHLPRHRRHGRAQRTPGPGRGCGHRHRRRAVPRRADRTAQRRDRAGQARRRSSGRAPSTWSTPTVPRRARSAGSPPTGPVCRSWRTRTTASRSTTSRTRSGTRRTSRIERRLARITDEVFAIGTGVATEALRRGLARPEALHRIAPAVAVEPRRTHRGHPRAGRARCSASTRTCPSWARSGGSSSRRHPITSWLRWTRSPHRDVHAVWVGSGPDARRTAELVRARGLAHRVHLVGERTDVDLLLPAFDVFAMASRYEGLPCAVVEAMHCGLPVVATAVNSVSDLVVPDESGLLVPPGRPELLAHAIDCLLDDPERAERLAARGQAVAAEGYDVAGLAGVLDAVYRRGLDRRLVASARTA